MSDAVIGSASFELRAKKDQLIRDVQSAGADVGRTVQGIERGFERAAQGTERSWQRATQNWAVATRRAEREIKGSANEIERAFGRAGTVLAGAFSVQQAIEFADAYTRTNNALKVAGVTETQLGVTRGRLLTIAQRYGVELESVARLYGSSRQAADDLGASERDLERFTSGVSAALAVQGASAAQSSGALFQLSQLLGGTVVQSQEFNAILDGARPILQAAADGNDRWAGSVARLRAEVVQGTVTSREFFESFLRGSAEMEQRATSVPLTISANLQVLRNSLVEYVGQTDASLGASERLGQAIGLLGRNIDVVAPALAAIAVALAGRYTAAVVTGTVANVAYTASLIRKAAAIYGVTRAYAAGAVAARTMSGAMAFFGGPLGLAITGVTLAIGAFAMANQRAAEAAAELRQNVDAQTQSFRSQQQAADQARQQTGALTDAELAAATAAAQLTGETNALANAHGRAAAAAKAQALEEARLAVQTARTNILQAETAYNERRTAETARVIGQINPRTGGIGGNIAPDVRGMADSSARNSNEARTFVQAGQNFRDATANLARVEATRLSTFSSAVPAASGGAGGSGGRATGSGSGGNGGSAGGAAPAGPSTQDLARTQEQLALELRIAEVRATGDESATAALERQRDRADLIRRLEEARVPNATAIADQHYRVVDAGESAARWAELQRQAAEGAADVQRDVARINEEDARRVADIANDRLRSELEIARLRGNDAAVRHAERELAITERITELRRLNPALSEAEARATATTGVNAIDAARVEGEFRDRFRSAFADGIEAAINGDLTGFMEGLADRFRRRMLEGLADQLFNVFATASRGLLMNQVGGAKGGLWSSVLGMFAGASVNKGSGSWANIGGSTGRKLPGFATGGDFTVGGWGGVDRQLVQFWGTPGEKVSVRTAAQAQRERRGFGMAPVVNFTIKTPDPAAFKASGAQIAAKLTRAVQLATRVS